MVSFLVLLAPSPPLLPVSQVLSLGKGLMEPEDRLAFEDECSRKCRASLKEKSEDARERKEHSTDSAGLDLILNPSPCPPLLPKSQGWIESEVICHYPSLHLSLSSLNGVVMWCE